MYIIIETKITSPFVERENTWDSISDMISTGASEKNGVSSIHLAAPEFDNDITSPHIISSDPLPNIISYPPRHITSPHFISLLPTHYLTLFHILRGT